MNDRYEGPSMPTYRCQVSRNCENVAFHKLGNGNSMPELGFKKGLYACETHTPRECRYCGSLVPWWDGTVCDWCDRYVDG